MGLWVSGLSSDYSGIRDDEENDGSGFWAAFQKVEVAGQVRNYNNNLDCRVSIITSYSCKRGP